MQPEVGGRGIMKPERDAPMDKKMTIAEELVAGFTELADALESGGDLGTEFSYYRMELDLKPHSYTPGTVKQTRSMLGASQRVFAKFLGVSVKTVSEWEQGRGTPKTM